MIPGKLLKRAIGIAAISWTAVVWCAQPPRNEGTTSSTAEIKAFLNTDLSLKSVFVPDLPVSAHSAEVAHASLRTCRCSCGFRCTTNADCGPGGVCQAGITCCATSYGQKELSVAFGEKDA